MPGFHSGARIYGVQVSAVPSSAAVARPDDATLALRALSIWLAVLVKCQSRISMPSCVRSRSITFDAICQAKMPSVTNDSTHRSIVVGRYDAYRQLAKVRWALLCLPACLPAATSSRTASTTTITKRWLPGYKAAVGPED
ncbi:hypothetical protein FP744_10002671 [Trichoderma asperellum]